MATITIAQAVLRGSRRGLALLERGGLEHPNIKEGAGQTYLAGQPVMQSSGLLVLATASSNQIANIAGFALQAATGVTNTSTRYKPILPDDLYLMNVKGHSGTVTTAQSQIGGHYNVDIDSTAKSLVVDLDNSFDATKLYVKILDLFTVAGGYPEGDVVGDTNGRVIAWVPDQLALQG